MRFEVFNLELNEETRIIVRDATRQRSVRPLRAVVRLFGIAFTCGALYLWLRVSDPVVRGVARARGAHGVVGVRRARLQRRWARTMQALIGMRVRIHGRPPRSPFVLVTNHLSYVDVVLLAARLHCVFVAKAEVARWPVAGRLCRSVDTVFVDRKNKRDIPRVMADMDASLRGGRGVVIFPEGTSSAGAAVMRFRPSLLEPAARSDRPVFYASLRYRTLPGKGSARDTVCWWGDMRLPGHVWNLLAMPGFCARLSFGAEPIREDDRKILATRLRDAVQSRFRPIV